jgi:hypothetical protein
LLEIEEKRSLIQKEKEDLKKKMSVIIVKKLDIGKIKLL